MNLFYFNHAHLCCPDGKSRRSAAGFSNYWSLSVNLNAVYLAVFPVHVVYQWLVREWLAGHFLTQHTGTVATAVATPYAVP